MPRSFNFGAIFGFCTYNTPNANPVIFQEQRLTPPYMNFDSHIPWVPLPIHEISASLVGTTLYHAPQNLVQDLQIVLIDKKGFCVPP